MEHCDMRSKDNSMANLLFTRTYYQMGKVHNSRNIQDCEKDCHDGNIEVGKNYLFTDL